VTITDKAPHALRQTIEAFLASIEHARPLAVSMNCSLGAQDMRPLLAELAELAPFYVACYPNAGLPNAMGEYDEEPPATAALLGEFATSGLVNIVGGCCGTTDAHIRAIAAAVADVKPRAVPDRRSPTSSRATRVSSRSPSARRPTSSSSASAPTSPGSTKFRRSHQGRRPSQGPRGGGRPGARRRQPPRLNRTRAMLDSEAAMGTFLDLIASEPEVARLPIVIDSSKWSVIEVGLKHTQGKSIVNSIFAQGRRGRLSRQGAHGAPVRGRGHRHAFDETGQAETVDREVALGQLGVLRRCPCHGQDVGVASMMSSGSKSPVR